MVSRTIAALTPDDNQVQDAPGQGTEKADMDSGHPEDADPSTTSNPEEKQSRYSTTSKDRKKLSVEECLYLATRGGASCLNLSHKIGAFEVGMEWDAQLIKLATVPEDEIVPTPTDSDTGLPELWGKENWSEKVAKWLFCGDDRNTKRVFVRGRLVHERRS